MLSVPKLVSHPMCPGLPHQGYRTVSDKVWVIGSANNGAILSVTDPTDPDGEGEESPLVAVYDLLESSGAKDRELTDNEM